jgi:hypothetical protein
MTKNNRRKLLNIKVTNSVRNMSNIKFSIIIPTIMKK